VIITLEATLNSLKFANTERGLRPKRLQSKFMQFRIISILMIIIFAAFFLPFSLLLLLFDFPRLDVDFCTRDMLSRGASPSGVREFYLFH
jgi:hypothetical protein